MTNIYKITFVSDPYTITKKDGSTCRKQTITLQELGGKFENLYAASWLSDKPCLLKEGTLVIAALRFSVRTYEGQDYQDVLLQEYHPLSPPIAHNSPSSPTIPLSPLTGLPSLNLQSTI